MHNRLTILPIELGISINDLRNHYHRNYSNENQKDKNVKTIIHVTYHMQFCSQFCGLIGGFLNKLMQELCCFHLNILGSCCHIYSYLFNISKKDSYYMQAMQLFQCSSKQPRERFNIPTQNQKTTHINNKYVILLTEAILRQIFTVKDFKQIL